MVGRVGGVDGKWSVNLRLEEREEKEAVSHAVLGEKRKEGKGYEWMSVFVKHIGEGWILCMHG